MVALMSELQVNGQTYVLELNFVSDKPFSLHEPIKYKFRLNDGEVFTFLICLTKKDIFIQI